METMRFSVKFGVDREVDIEMQLIATSHLNAFAHAQAAITAMREKGESSWDPEQPGATISIKLIEP